MKLKNILKGGVALTLAITLTLTACGTSTDETPVPEAEPETIKEINTFSLIGTWRSRPDIDDTYYEAVISADSDISVYYFADDSCYLYWKGTFNTYAEADSITAITSARNESADMIRTDNETPFLLHTDGRLFFYDSSKYGMPVSVYLNYVTNAYVKEYEVIPFVYPYDEEDTNIAGDNIDDGISEDTEGSEDISGDTETAGRNASDVTVEDNSTDNITAESDANNGTDKEGSGSDTNASVSSEGTDNAPEYTYTDKSETMYATIGLNVRSGPSTAFNVITSYNKGDAVTVTGICNETGWSRVEVNGTTGYVDTNYLSEANSVNEAAANNSTVSNSSAASDNGTASNSDSNTSSAANTVQTQADSYVSGGFPLYNYSWLSGQYLGRGRIPSVGVNVALYYSSSQSVCDAYDSACFFYFMDPPSECNYTIIFADHQNQGFSAIKNCTYGTALYIDGINGNTYKYVCDRIEYNGHNDLVHIYDSNWNVLDTSGGLWAYTCNNSWQNITAVHFSPV